MLGRKFRLKKESDFKRVYRRGRRERGLFFDFTFLRNYQGLRFGIVTTTATIKKAVKRNLAKRVLRGMLIKNQDLWPKNCDLIIKIKKELEPKKEAEAELISYFKRLNV